MYWSRLFSFKWIKRLVLLVWLPFFNLVYCLSSLKWTEIEFIVDLLFVRKWLGLVSAILNDWFSLDSFICSLIGGFFAVLSEWRRAPWVSPLCECLLMKRAKGALNFRAERNIDAIWDWVCSWFAPTWTQCIRTDWSKRLMLNVQRFRDIATLMHKEKNWNKE